MEEVILNKLNILLEESCNHCIRTNRHHCDNCTVKNITSFVNLVGKKTLTMEQEKTIYSFWNG